MVEEVALVEVGFCGRCTGRRFSGRGYLVDNFASLHIDEREPTGGGTN